jgi:integrase/recombinase XerD
VTIRAVPFKRFAKAGLCYLDKPEIDALLAAPDVRTPLGQRDHALLLFLYNSGARVSEAAAVTIADINRRPDGSGAVRLIGKGAKMRFCPLWSTTMGNLAELAGDRPGPERLFINQRRQPLTRYGIHSLVRRHTHSASKQVKSILQKRVSSHTIRHTTATHLLRAGVDINTIRAWLGHVSIDTTNIYAETDLEAKAKLIEQCESFEPSPTQKRSWCNDRSLMGFLRSL